MTTFTVTKVIDGDTLEVSPEWDFGETTGKRVRLAGVYAPELDEQEGKAAQKRLSDLVLNKEVRLHNAKNLSHGRLVCDVFVNGRNIKNSF